MFDPQREIATLQGQIAAMVLQQQEAARSLESLMVQAKDIPDINRIANKYQNLFDGLAADITALQQGRAFMLDRLNEAQARLDNHVDKITDIDKEHDSLAGGLSSCNMKTDSELSNINKTLSHHSTKLGVFQGSFEYLQKRQDDLDRQMEAQKQYVISLARLVDEKENVHAVMVDRLEALTKKLDALQSDFSKTVESMNQSGEQFKTNVADKLSTAMNLVERTYADKLNQVNQVISRAGLDTVNTRVDILSEDASTAAQKLALIDRQFELLGRRLDKIEVALKGLTLK